MIRKDWSFSLVKSVQIQSFAWSVFSCVRTKYGDLRSKSPYSVRIQENTYQKKHFGHFSRSTKFANCIYITKKLTNFQLQISKLITVITCYHTEIVILTSSYCLFETEISQVICSTSLSFNLTEDKAWSMISK